MEKEVFVSDYEKLREIILNSVINNVPFSTKGYDADALKKVGREIAESALVGDFEILYQPQVNFDGTVKSAEAFVNQTLYDVEIDRRVLDFLARTNKFETEISGLTFAKICRDMEDIVKGLGDDYMIMFKLNPTLFNDEFCQYYCETLIDHKLKPENIAIAFSQGANFETLSAELMEKLKSLGTRFILDNYGLEQNDFNTLQSFPFDFVKIAREVTSKIHQSDEQQQIVEDLIHGYHRNFKVVADGVQSEQEFETLQNLSARMIQGYVFSNIFSKEELIEKSSTVSKGLALQ